MKLDQVLLHGDRVDQPDPEDVAGGSLYCVDDESFIIEQAQGAVGARTWEPYSPTGGSATAIDALTGDVTATGPGSVAATIPNDTVTYAKMQNISAASRILGRGSAGGSGDTQELTVGSGLSITGTVLDTTGGGGGITQLTGDVTAGPGSGSQAATIANNAVTTAKILDANVTLAKIVDASAANVLLGRGSAGGSGDFQEITLGTGLSMASQVLSASGSGNAISSTAVGSEPGSPATGDLDLYNNGQYISRYSGSAWVPWGPISPMVRPIDSGFSWVNQGGASLSSTNGQLTLTGPADTTDNIRSRVMTAPATPYVLTAYIDHSLLIKNFCRTGLLFRQSSDSKLVTFGPTGNSSGAIMELTAVKWTNDTTFNANYQTSVLGPGRINWFRIADNGTNRIMSISTDGINWMQIHSVGRTDFLTANQIGFFIASVNNATPNFAYYMSVVSWSVT